MRDGQTRKRASAPRSRTGCPTCKIRHVRCDETKPNCRKCTSTGRACDYPKIILEQSKQILASQVILAKQTISPLTSTIYSVSFQAPGSRRDRQVLHYYRTQAAHDMSGFLPSDFWTDILMRTSHHEPAVRHALVAFNSAKLSYEASSDGDMARKTSVESQIYYNKALKHVRGYVSANSSTVVVLQCCILLHQFDSMRGDYQAASMHLENALAIFQNVVGQDSNASKPGSDSAFSNDMDEIQSVLVRMDLQETLFNDARVPKFRYSGLEAYLGPQRFLTIRAAQKSLDYILNSFWKFLTTNLSYVSFPLDMIPPAVINDKKLLKLRFQTWEAAYEQLVVDMESKTGGSNRDSNHKAGLGLLSLLHKGNQLILDANCPEDPSVFSKSPNRPVEKVLQLSENLISETNRNVSNGRRRVFSAETGVVAPLFLVAIKCSDPLLSSRAIDLLERCNRKEGLWDGELILDIIRAVQQRDEVPVSESCSAYNFDSNFENDSREPTKSPPNAALETKIADFADMDGGVAVMARMLGVKTGLIL